MADSNSRPTPSLAEIVRKVEPSLVCVKTPASSGSGFVVDDAGNVITNAHVVEHYTDMDLEFVNGATSSGTVVGVNWDLDLACIRLLDAVDVVPVPMGDSDSALVGEEVLAMGYPLSEILEGSPTVTRGIISAKRPGRLQTDAAINPGSSGGPLVDSQGRVIGVNTSVIDVAQGRNIEGIGFAIAINQVKTELASLISGVGTPAHRTREPSDPGQGEWRSYLVGSGRFSIRMPATWDLVEFFSQGALFSSSGRYFWILVSMSEVFSEDPLRIAVEDSLFAFQRDTDDWSKSAVTSHGWEAGREGSVYAIHYLEDQQDGLGRVYSISS